MARVTVVIPTYNRAELLKRSIQSVLDQTVDDFELVIADNGSTDHTGEVVASYDDPRITYAPLPENIGPDGNFTRSLRLGTAPFVTLLQDDDLMRPANLERKLEVLEARDDVVLAHSAFALIDENDDVVEEFGNWVRSRVDMIEPGPVFVEKSMSAGCRVDFSAAVMRRTAVADEEYRVDEAPPNDMGLWLRLATRGAVAYVAEPLVAIRVHQATGSVSTGTYEVVGARWRPTFEAVRTVQYVKERFLDEFGPQLGDVGRLRAAAQRAGRKNLQRVVLERSLPERRLRQTVRLLREAADVDPGVVRDPGAARLVLASVIGPRGRSLGRRLGIQAVEPRSAQMAREG